jgi:transposase, IS5 family
MAGQPGFFDLDERYAALSGAGDPLERLTAVVDFGNPPVKAALR